MGCATTGDAARPPPVCVCSVCGAERELLEDNVVIDREELVERSPGERHAVPDEVLGSARPARPEEAKVRCLSDFDGKRVPHAERVQAGDHVQACELGAPRRIALKRRRGEHDVEGITSGPGLPHGETVIKVAEVI